MRIPGRDHCGAAIGAIMYRLYYLGNIKTPD